jgi:hypothetical protein
MVRTRWIAAALVLATIAWAASVSNPAVAAAVAPGATLSGVVKDEVGRALEGAEVLVLAPDGRGGALLRAVSGAGGRFVIGSLTPGVYRVAAIKSGYIAALGRVNTLLRSSVDLVLRPIPKAGEPGAQDVQSDLSWTLRVPPRSILKEIEAEALVAGLAEGGPKPTSLHMPESLRGQIEHVVALGAWRSGSTGPSSALSGNETRMQFGGNLGQRGAIHVEGRRGNLDSSSGADSGAAVSRAASDLDVDMSYDTGDDALLAMRAFYSTGALEVGDPAGKPGGGARQGQRSWGYEGQWHKQVDGGSRVALQVGFHDANLELARGVQTSLDGAFRDASNRAIGAEGQFESFVGAGHLMRFGVRAQVLSLAAPSARIGRSSGAFALDGTTGWSVLLDGEDQWSLTGPFSVSYGLALRQGFDGPLTTTATPRVGGSWSSSHLKARAELSYLATADLATGSGAAPQVAHPSPFGYGLELEAPVSRTVTLRGTASYVPLRANVWAGAGDALELQDLYVTDGFASDRFVAVALERSAGDAKVSFRIAQGRAEGVLAPALDPDVPVLVLSDRAMGYQSLRLGTVAPRAGSALSIEYRAIREQAAGVAVAAGESLKTVQLEFAQQLVRLAGGRASCRLLLTARSAVGPAPQAPEADPSEARHFAALYQRVGAGLSLAF